MRNLKKILSLALALVMVMSLLTVAGAREFNDAADIEHTEAVEVMSSLGVINGKGNNTFDPKGNVTRGEMAKMITYISLGNVEPTAFLGTTTNLTDITGHWAEAYIKYCYSQGIIAGRGNGIFDPNANVTATEAARMLLVAIGYNADVQVYTGSQWNINVVRDAQLSHLYDDVSVTSTEILNRDKAAQMMYNALNAKTIVKSSQVDRVTGDITDIYTANGPTLLAKSYEAKVWIGAFTGNEKSGATNLVDGIQVYGKLEDADENDSDTNANFVYDYDIANIGEEVKVIFKDGTGGTKGKPDKNDTIYGVYKTGKTEVVTATVNDIKDGSDAPAANNKIKVGSTEYKVATPASADVIIEKNYDSSTDVSGKTTAAAAKAAFEALKDAQNGDAVKFILNDNSEIISAYVTETRISYVTAINSNKITLNGVGTIDVDDNDIYANAAKNDIVTYTRLYDTDKDDAYFIVALAESISGTMTGYKYASSKYESLSMDGTSYKTFKKAPLSATINSEQTVTAFSGDDIDEDFTIYLVNGYVGYVMRSSDSANKYALVTNANTGKLGSTFDEPKAELLLADGTKVTAVLDKKSVIYADSSKYVQNSGSQLSDNGSDAISDGNKGGALPVGQIVRYSVTSDNTYKIIEVLPSDGNYGLSYTMSQSGKLYDDDLKCVYKTPGTLSTDVVTSGDCVLFLKNTADNSYKVYKIRDLKDITVSGAAVGVLTKDGKAVAVYSELNGRPSGASSDRTYGIVSSYNGTTKVSGDSYYSWTVQNDQGEYTVLMDTTTKLGTGTGSVISFEAVSDNVYNDGDITVYDGTDFTDAAKGLATWVKEYNEGDKTITYWTAVTKVSDDEFTGNTPKTVALDDDCVIIYINSDGKKGGDNVGISEFDTSTGYRNVILVKDDNSSKVVAILVESSRDKDILRADVGDITGTPVVPPVVDVPDDKKEIAADGSAGTVAYTLSGTPSTANDGTVSFTLTPKTAVTNANGDKVTISYNVSTPAARAAVADGDYTKEVIVPNGSTAAITVEITGVAGKKVTITSVAVAAAPAPAEKVTIAGANEITAVSGTKGGYTFSAPGEVTVGEDFTVTVTCKSVDPANTNGEIVSVTYNSVTKKTAAFKAAGTADLTFTAAKGVTTMTASVEAASVAPTTAATPSITKDVASTATVGDKLSVTATVTDGGTLSYQWYKAAGDAINAENDTAVADATAAEYTTTEAGKFYVVVTNTNNAATTTKTATANSALCTVSPASQAPATAATPTIKTDVKSTATVGEKLAVVAEVADGGTLSYQWYKAAGDAINAENDTAVADATAAEYTTTEAGKFYVVVTNTNNEATTTKTATANSALCTVSQ